MSVDERIRTTLLLEASSVSPPAVDLPALRGRAVQVRRRRRTAVASLAAAVVVTAVSLGVVLAPHPSQEPSPAPRPGQVQVPLGAPPPGAVWYDADGLHHGQRVYDVPGTAAPISITLVRDGAVYLVPSTLHIRYQPWHGPARDIGRGSREAGWLLGPGSDPGGSTAAWFDGSDLVMFDTARDVEVARVAEPGRRVMPYLENQFGTRFFYVDDRRVVWDGQQGGVITFDRVTGRTTVTRPVRRIPAPFVVDWQAGLRTRVRAEAGLVSTRPGPAGTELLSKSDSPARFSPDGQFLVSLDVQLGRIVSRDAVVVDTHDGSSWQPVATTQEASIGWGYGHTLLYLQSDGTGLGDGRTPLYVIDPQTEQVVAVAHRGEVILPAN
jgi:hypothetical protein